MALKPLHSVQKILVLERRFHIPTENHMPQKIIWSCQKKNIAELKPAPYNPRKLSAKQEKQLGVSMDKFGVAEPIVINSNNNVIGGHQRLKILKQQHIETVEVMGPNRLLTPTEEKELNLRLNKNTGEWDIELLITEFTSEMIADVGFDSSDLKVDFGSDIAEKKEKEIDQVLQVLVECSSEAEQEEVYELLKKEGYKSRIISI